MYVLNFQIIAKIRIPRKATQWIFEVLSARNTQKGVSFFPHVPSTACASPMPQVVE